jgi:hypothetical protein
MVFMVITIDGTLTWLIKFQGFLTFLDFKWRVAKTSLAAVAVGPLLIGQI